MLYHFTETNTMQRQKILQELTDKNKEKSYLECTLDIEGVGVSVDESRFVRRLMVTDGMSAGFSTL